MQSGFFFEKLHLRAVCDAKKRCEMASYHLSVKAISRSAGRSATGAAAYRSGEQIVDERTGVIHDYTRRRGVEECFLVVPDDAPAWSQDRAALWNAAEQSEKRKNSTVAREFEVALPVELSVDERRALVEGVAKELMTRHGIAVDVCIHEPHKDGDQRNHHAHILTSTRRLGADGFGEKARELDDQKSGEVSYWRERWAVLQNEALGRCGQSVRVDHRSLEAQAEAERVAQVVPAVVSRESDLVGEQHATPVEEPGEGRGVSLSNAVPQDRERETDPKGVSSPELPAPPPARLPTIHMGAKAMAMERKAQRKAEKDGVPLTEPVTQRAQWNQARLKENQQRDDRWQAWLVEHVQLVKKKAQELWSTVREGMQAVKDTLVAPPEPALAGGVAALTQEMVALKPAETLEKERQRQRDYEELIVPLPEKKKPEASPASDLTLVKPPTVEAVGEEAKGRVAESLESKPLSPQPPVSRETPEQNPPVSVHEKEEITREKKVEKDVSSLVPPVIPKGDKKAAFWAGHAAEWGRSEEEARRELIGEPVKPTPRVASQEEIDRWLGLDPESQRQAAEKAKQRAYDEKPLSELEAEFTRLESLTKWEDVWAQLPAVVEAQTQRNEAKECYQQSVKEYEGAQHYHQTTERQERDWRKAHPVKALSHDQGVWRSSELAEREKRTVQAKAQVEKKQVTRDQAKAAYDRAEAVWGSLVREPTLHKQAQQAYQQGREEARELAKAIQPRRAAQAEVEEVMKSLKVASQLHAKGGLPGVSPALLERLKHWHTLEKKDTLAFIEHKNTLKRQLSTQPELRAQLKAELAPHAHVLAQHRDRDRGLSR